MIDQPKRLFEKQIDDAVRAELEDVLEAVRSIMLATPFCKQGIEIYIDISKRLGLPPI